MSLDEKTYEEVYADLERLVDEIEKPERSLEAISADIRKALEMIAWCKARIHADKESMDKILEEARQ